jgi:hypothetical protein
VKTSYQYHSNPKKVPKYKNLTINYVKIFRVYLNLAIFYFMGFANECPQGTL